MLLWPFCIEIQRVKDYGIITSILLRILFFFPPHPLERELKYNDKFPFDSWLYPYFKHNLEVVYNFHFLLFFNFYYVYGIDFRYLYCVPNGDIPVKLTSQSPKSHLLKQTRVVITTFTTWADFPEKVMWSQKVIKALMRITEPS